MRRQFASSAAKSDGLPHGVLAFDLVTGDLDTFKTRLRPEGARFRPAKPWLDAHDSDSCGKQIGKIVDVDQSTERLRVNVLFDLESEDAREVYRKHVDGFLDGCSVGFDPIAFHVEDEDGQKVLVYDEYWVLEGSSCPVPSNPQALLVRSAGGSDSARLKMEDALRATAQNTAQTAAQTTVQTTTEKASENRAHHLSADVRNVPNVSNGSVPSAAFSQFTEPMKMKPEHRSHHRYMVGDSLRAAEDHMHAMGMHTKAEHRAYHRDAAAGCMERAMHMARMINDSIAEGHDDAAADAEMIGSMMRACPVADDAEMAKKWEACQRAALPHAAQTFHSAATVLGFTGPEDMIVSFRAAESVQAQYRKVLADQRATQNKTVEAERAKLVADLVSSAVGLSPALEAEMLGIDPMDREAAVREKRSVKRKGQPWSVEQIRRYAMKVEGETSAIQTRVAAPLKSGNDQPAAQGPLAPAEPAVKPPVMTRSAVEEAVLEAAKYMNIKPQSVAVAMKQ